ncbi:MAG: hypothetical protein ACP5LV_06410, partial [Thermoplasmata archaeon]
MIEGSNPPSPPERKSKKNLWFGIIVIIVVVAVIASIVSVSMTAQINPHFGFITLGTAKQVTGANLIQSTTVSTSFKMSGVIKTEETYYNSTSSGSILIVIAQFSNSTTTNNFFNKEMIALKSEQAKIINGSYDTFN